LEHNQRKGKWVKRRFRLRSSTDFKRVRQIGKSFAHPLVVLVVEASSESLKIGITAGRSVGTAVERNRAKRRLREAINPRIPQIRPGVNLILIARQPVLKADWPDLEKAIQTLLVRAHLIQSLE
jgi:ribonuclease P protein component